MGDQGRGLLAVDLQPVPDHGFGVVLATAAQQSLEQQFVV